MHIGGLAPETDEAGVQLLCERFGQVVAVRLPREAASGASRGYAFVLFALRTSCERAYQALDGAKLDGKRIRTDFAQSDQSVAAFRGLLGAGSSGA